MVESLNQMINSEKKKLIANYAMSWQKMIAEWNSDRPEDACWLTFSACYLFRTNNVRWALDPVSLLHRISKTHATDFASDFKQLAFVLISHLDIDHFDKLLINQLANSNTKWLIPAAIATKFIERTTLKLANLIVVEPGDTVKLNGITIKTYDGFHDSDSAKIAAAAFYIDTDSHKLFFPGDTRRYESSRLPEIADLNYFFAHLWLGFDAALNEQHKLLLPFCDFCTALKPEKIIIAHLFEVARDNNSYWNRFHADKARRLLENSDPDIKIIIPPLTTRIKL